MPIYMRATLSVRTGHLQPLLETLTTRVFPLIEREAGWKLLGCFSHLTGPINTITDLWELPDHEALMKGRGALAAAPDIQELRAVMNAAIQEETLVIMDKVPYPYK